MDTGCEEGENSVRKNIIGKYAPPIVDSAPLDDLGYIHLGDTTVPLYESLIESL